MVAFVLSGGASHGAVQVGMLRALAEAGIEPDAIYGTSVGAINASAVSHLPRDSYLDRLSDAWHEFASNPLVRPSPIRQAIAVARRERSLSSLEPLRSRLMEVFGNVRVEDARIPLSVTATDLLTGRERQLDRGALIDVVMASCAVPGLFPPVEIDGVPYVDGLLYGAPVEAASAQGHTTIYLLSTNTILAHEALPTTWWGIARRAATMIMWSQLTIPDRIESGELAMHVVPAPASMSGVKLWDFSQSERMISDAHVEASRWIASLREKEAVS